MRLVASSSLSQCTQVTRRALSRSQCFEPRCMEPWTSSLLHKRDVTVLLKPWHVITGILSQVEGVFNLIYSSFIESFDITKHGIRATPFVCLISRKRKAGSTQGRWNTTSWGWGLKVQREMSQMCHLCKPRGRHLRLSLETWHRAGIWTGH